MEDAPWGGVAYNNNKKQKPETDAWLGE